jgi:hypothetical protein
MRRNIFSAPSWYLLATSPSVFEKLLPEALLGACRDLAIARDDEVVLHLAGILAGLDLARQLGAGGLRVRDLADELRVVLDELVDRRLRELQIASAVDHVERDRLGRQRGWTGKLSGRVAPLGALRLGLGRAARGQRGSHGRRDRGDE